MSGKKRPKSSRIVVKPRIIWATGLFLVAVSIGVFVALLPSGHNELSSNQKSESHSDIISDDDSRDETNLDTDSVEKDNEEFANNNQENETNNNNNAANKPENNTRNSQSSNTGSSNATSLPKCRLKPDTTNYIVPQEGECYFYKENNGIATVNAASLPVDKPIKAISNDPSVASLRGGFQNTGGTSLMTYGGFHIIFQSAGKTSIVLSKASDETVIAVIYVEMRIVVHPVSSLSITCPDRSIFSSDDTVNWRELTYNYLPANATTLDKTTISASPSGFIETKSDNGVLYVKPSKVFSGNDDIPPITITVANEAVSVSCSF